MPELLGWIAPLTNLAGSSLRIPMTDEPDTQPPAAPAPPPIPRFDAPLPPRAAQRLDEATATRHDITHATRPPWPKYDADKPDPGHRGKRQCIGRSTQTGSRCKLKPCDNKERCKFHGGRTTGRPPKGRSRDRDAEVRGASGRYFESMGKLAKVYQEALTDSALTDTREPLAALDAFTRRALKRAVEADVPEYRESMLKLSEQAESALAAGDLEALRVAVESLTNSARAGVRADESDAVAIDALRTFSERVDAYWKTKLDRKQAINARDLALILQRIVDIIQAEVPGEAALRVAKAIDVLMIQSGRAAERRDAQDVALIGGPRADE